MKIRSLDVLALAVLVPAAGLAAYRFSPAFRATALVLAGRSPSCPWSKAIKSSEMIQEHVATAEKLDASMRQVRQDGSLTLWDTPRGQFWAPSGDMGVLKSLLAEQARKIYGDTNYGVRPGDIVLDCGAHIGVYTREALDSGAKLVVAIEPAPANAECIRRNFARELAAGKVILYNKGVWSGEGHLTFHVDPKNSAGNTIVFSEKEKRASDFEISVTTIDSIASELKLPRVDFIKMDIEGSERQALAGAKMTLTKHKPRMALCTYHMADDPVVVPQVVASLEPSYGVTCGPCGEMDGRIIPHTLFFQ